MELNERELQIMEILRSKRFATVKYLAEQTYISESSMRRDLTALERKGLVERSYGGASIVGGETLAANIVARMSKNARAKRRIAQRASKLLKDGMTVLLDASTTAYYMVEHIAKRKDITLITNGTLTAQKAIDMGITVYLTGGRSEGGSHALAGSYAEEMLEKVSADIAFFSSMAMKYDGTVCDCNEGENKIRKIMMTRAAVRALMIDTSKLGKNARHVLCQRDELEYVFTEND